MSAYYFHDSLLETANVSQFPPLIQEYWGRISIIKQTYSQKKLLFLKYHI